MLRVWLQNCNCNEQRHQKHPHPTHPKKLLWICNQLTYRHGRWDASLEEVEPEDDLSELFIGRVLQAEGDQVQTVGVPQEMVVQHVVRFVA